MFRIVSKRMSACVQRQMLTPCHQISYRLFSQEKIGVTTGNPVAAYSSAVKANGNVYISGQLGMDFSTKELVSDDSVEQTTKALSNLKLVADDAGTNLNNVVKTTVLLADINDFEKVNQAYSDFFAKNGVKVLPARACYAVAALPKGAKVEIEAIAVE